MDFTIPSAVENYRARIAAFVERELIPLEADPHAYDPHENIRLDLLSELRGKRGRRGCGASSSSRRRAAPASARSAWRCATRR